MQVLVLLLLLEPLPLLPPLLPDLPIPQPPTTTTSASNSTSVSSTTANGGTNTNSGNSLQYYYTGNNTSNSVDGNKYSLPSIYFTPQDSINNTSHTYNPYTTVSGAVTPQNYQLDYSQSSTVNNNYQFTLPNQQLSSPQQQQYNRSYSNSLMPNYHYNNTTTNINTNVGSNTSPQLSNSNTPNPISPVLILIKTILTIILTMFLYHHILQ